MLNAARLDFDGRMDWSKVTNATEFTSYDISATEEIVPRSQGMDIVMNKEFPIPGDIIRALPPSVKLIAEASWETDVGERFHHAHWLPWVFANLHVCDLTRIM